MNKILYFIFAFQALLHSGFGQTFAPELAIKLQSRLDSMKTVHNIRGISASVIYPGQGMWQGVAGISHIGSPITKEMAFGIGSNTKLFTAVALLKLTENGQVRLQDALHKWLPTYPNINPDITIRQILNHTSGIRDITDFPGFRDSINANPSRVFSPHALMAWVGSPLFAAGSAWSYSNTNYILAGMVIEAVSGRKFGKILRDSILTPLLLDSTFLSVEEKPLSAIAHPWQNGLDTYATPRTAQNSATWAAGGMYATSGEMAQWYDALMNGRVLSQKAFKEMTTFTGPAEYGFGISKQALGSRGIYGHSGLVPGYVSFCAFDTLTRAVVCILINATPSVQPRLIAQELLLTLVNDPILTTKSPLSGHNIGISPNPSNGEFRLLFPKEMSPDFPLQVFITDISGRVILTQTIQNEADMIKTQYLPKGIFWVRAGRFAGKIINTL